MGILSNLATALQDRIRLTRELQRMIALRQEGFPGWDAQIAALQDRLFACHPSPQKGRRGIHGNPGEGDLHYTSGPEGSFDFNRDQDDRKRMQQGGMNQLMVQQIPCTTVGYVPGFNPFYCDHNGLQVIARTMDDNGNVFESSDTARVFIKLNRPNGPWVPLGFTFAPQSVAKSDNLVFQGYIEKFWVYVQQVTQDALNQPNLIIALLRSAALFGPGGGSNLYSSPSNTSPTMAAISQQGQGGSGTGIGGSGGPGISTAPLQSTSKTSVSSPAFYTGTKL